MEALSCVASGMAVASLSIQLIDSIVIIKTFIRNVRDAQQELERLVDLLERLEALLEDVRALTERQTSLQAENFPMPSMTIFKCLKSCEKILEPFHAMVDKYTPATSKAGTRMNKLKTGLRFSLKAKDVKDFEKRIEREIGFLNASLGANCGAILMQLGPVLLKNQNNNEATCPSYMEIPIPDSKSAIVSSKEDMTSLSTTRTTRASSSVVPVHWSLRRLGVHRRKIVRRIPGNLEQRSSGSEYDHEPIVSEDYETTLLWSVLGYGLTWIQRRSFGVMLPSLSTFPVVDEFPSDIDSAMENGGIQEFQDLLHRGVIHPFSRDCSGNSLLHIAAVYSRTDIYILLLRLGLKQSRNIWGNSPLRYALSWGEPSLTHDRITICRYVLEDTELSVDLDFYLRGWCFAPKESKMIQWLYQQSKGIPLREDALRTQLIVIEAFCSMMSGKQYASQTFLAKYDSLDVKSDVFDHLQLGGGSLLKSLFRLCLRSETSFEVGGDFLEWLSNSGVNVEQFVSNQIANLGSKALLKSLLHHNDRRVVFRALETGEWELGFEWELDEEACGYLLVSEYQSLTVEARYGRGWPFFDFNDGWWPQRYKEWEAKRNVHFQRRMAAKARKERTRSGQKIPRSRMPGAWIY